MKNCSHGIFCLVLAFGYAWSGCASSSGPATTSGTGGDTSKGGEGGSGGKGGSGGTTTSEKKGTGGSAPGGSGGSAGSGGASSGGSGGTSVTGGSGGTAGSGTGGSTTSPGTGGTTGPSTTGPVVTPNGISVLPVNGQGMTSYWTAKPYIFGPWFTYAFHTGAAVDPKGAITTTAGKMCITLTGTATAAGGGAIGFKVCAAPKYPDALGQSSWFPFACPGANCIESEAFKPYSACGGKIASVTFEGTGVAKVAFQDAADKTMAEVVPTGGTASPPAGRGGDVTAIHFKSFTDGQVCLSAVYVKLE